jgi:predicted ATPase
MLSAGTELATRAQASEAVQLFVARARMADSSFDLTSDNAASVVRICARLDGIPLAIEMAAARLSVLSVDQIAARLDDRFRLLTGGSRAALPRQQTLRAALDWSYNLLNEPERRLLRRLSMARPSGAGARQPARGTGMVNWPGHARAGATPRRRAELVLVGARLLERG